MNLSVGVHDKDGAGSRVTDRQLMYLVCGFSYYEVSDVSPTFGRHEAIRNETNLTVV